jgi:chemotaxis response regulator CheB
MDKSVNALLKRDERTKGGKTFAQDQRSCTVFGMPDAARRMGAVEAFAEPRGIGAYLCKLMGPPERTFE